jgi:hypothetical protein
MKRFKVVKDKKAHTTRRWLVVDSQHLTDIIIARSPDKRSAKHYASILNRRPSQTN